MKSMKNKWWIFIILVVALTMSACGKQEVETKTQSTPVDNTPVENAESEAIVKIDGTLFDKSDLEFYTLMQVINIELARNENNNDYVNERLKQFENSNVQLQTLIEIHAMSLLAKEKNYFIPPEKLEKKVEEFKSSVDEKIENMLSDFGEAEVNSRIRSYFEKVMLQNRVVADLEKQVQESLPNASDQEIAYEVTKQYEELYMDQIGDLELKIYMK